MKMVSDRMKARYDRAANTEWFHERQLVLLYNPQWKKGLSPKLQTSWDGPYKIIKRLNGVVYRIQKAAPEQKLRSYTLSDLQNMGKEIMSLFGMNRIKCTAVLRK